MPGQKQEGGMFAEIHARRNSPLSPDDGRHRPYVRDWTR